LEPLDFRLDFFLGGGGGGGGPGDPGGPGECGDPGGGGGGPLLLEPFFLEPRFPFRVTRALRVLFAERFAERFRDLRSCANMI